MVVEEILKNLYVQRLNKCRSYVIQYLSIATGDYSPKLLIVYYAIVYILLLDLETELLLRGMHDDTGGRSGDETMRVRLSSEGVSARGVVL